MSEKYLLVNNLDGQNRRWLEQNIAYKPQDLVILDWNEHQTEWRSKNMSMVISSFPTFVEKDGDSQFFVSNPIDWDDAINQLNWQKELLLNPENEIVQNEIKNKQKNRHLLHHCIQALQENNEEHKQYILESLGLSILATNEQIFDKMTELGADCEISRSRIISSVLL